MKATLATLAILGVSSTAAFADGHIAAGEKAFSQCQTCHVVVDDDGNTLAGRNAKTGPNLYGIVGRTAGTVEGFRYGDDLVAAGEKGLVWDEETFLAYVQNPSAFLKEYLEDNSARGRMSFRVRKEEDAANLYAYLMSIGPEGEAVGEATN